jgi:serine/threonine-protein kinase
MIGEIVLNYRLIWLIGEGGMGNVYYAEHLEHREKVAIKILHSQFLSNEQIKIRFKSEALVLSKLSHPNIVKLINYLEDVTGMYLIMEYVEGVTLEHYIYKVSGPIPEEKSVSMMCSLLEAFSYAHRFVVHRDIKPSNILINPYGNLKILDFGIARIMGSDQQNLTRTGTQLGTVYYMSPEQVQGLRVDQRSDIYSLGFLFYEMLTGNQPLKSSTTEYQVYNRIVNEEFPAPQSIYPSIPLYFNSILKKSMAKSPQDRFQNCDEFKRAIERRKPLFSTHQSKEDTTYSKTFRKASTNTKTPSENNPDNFTKKMIAFFIGLILCLVLIEYLLK